MKTTSTRNAEPRKGGDSPRLPHERDESSDSGAGGQSSTGRIAHDDAESAREETDRSKESDATYRDNLRGKTPGAERDKPADR